MHSLKDKIMEVANPFKLVSVLEEHGSNFAALVEREAIISGDIYTLEVRKSEIEYDVALRVDSFSDEDLKDPKTGRKNTQYIESLALRLCRKDEEYRDIEEKLVALNVRRKVTQGQARAAEIKFSATRHVSRLVSAMMEMDSTI